MPTKLRRWYILNLKRNSFQKSGMVVTLTSAAKEAEAGGLQVDLVT